MWYTFFKEENASKKGKHPKDRQGDVVCWKILK